MAAVDATQAAEVPFALMVEWFFFSGVVPDATAWVGIVLDVGGISAYAVSSTSVDEVPTELEGAEEGTNEL